MTNQTLAERISALHRLREARADSEYEYGFDHGADECIPIIESQQLLLREARDALGEFPLFDCYKDVIPPLYDKINAALGDKV
jgi:hypothetical protein